MTQNKPGLLTSAFLSALLLGCSHMPAPESPDEPQLYKIDDYGSLRVITNDFGIWNDATLRLKRNADGPQNPQQEMEIVAQEITTIALQRGFQLCSKKAMNERSVSDLIEESDRADDVLPAEKFAGFYVYQS